MYRLTQIKINKIQVFCFFLCVSLSLPAGADLWLNQISVLAADSDAAKIAIIKSRDIEPYNIAISGFKRVVRGSMKINNMDGDIKRGVDIIDSLKLNRPDIILTLGAEATYMASQNVKKIPIVFSMVSNPRRYNIGRGNVTGIGLDIPLRTQLGLYRDILPNAKKIGVIYSDEETKRFIDKASLTAGEFGIEILSIRVKDIKGLPNAVENILTKCDSLWLIFDPLVTSSQTVVKDIVILHAVLKNIPVVGFNKWCVTVGSLYCLYSEYEDIGRQTGEMVNRVLEGKNPSDIPVESPKEIKILFNDKIIERVGSRHKVNIPPNAYIWGGE